MIIIDFVTILISIHTLVKRVTFEYNENTQSYINFNSHSRKESDQSKI